MYRTYGLEFSQYEAIIYIWMRFQERIRTINTDLLDNEKVFGKTMVFSMVNWSKWRGIQFDDKGRFNNGIRVYSRLTFLEVLNHHSLHILNAVSNLISSRYGWGFMFVENVMDEKKWIHFPWNEPIKSKFDCYLGKGLLKNK